MLAVYRDCGVGVGSEGPVGEAEWVKRWRARKRLTDKLCNMLFVGSIQLVVIKYFSHPHSYTVDPRLRKDRILH